LHQIQELSLLSAQFKIITIRLRVDKNQLLLKSTETQPTLYLFVSRTVKLCLCKDFEQEIADKLQIPLLVNVQNFSQFFKYLMQLSATRSFNLIIDEFQEFLNINASVNSDMQRDIDTLKA
jgi:AAA+ ATPase superfamily predicted ATPase